MYTKYSNFFSFMQWPSCLICSVSDNKRLCRARQFVRIYKTKLAAGCQHRSVRCTTAEQTVCWQFVRMMDTSSKDTLSCNMTFNITEDDVAEHEYDLTERTLVTIVMPCILTFGLAGNLGFLFVLSRVTWMRTILNFYLTHLAIADILFLSISVMEKVFAYCVSPLALDKYFMGVGGCITVHLVLDICYFASVSLITLVTLERYYATCQPHVHREHSTRPRAVRLVAMVWLCSFVLACMLIPSNAEFFTFCLTWPIHEQKYQHYPSVMGLCLAVGDWLDDLADVLHSVPFIIAMLINILFFSKIIRALNSMVARAQRSGFSDRSQHIRNRVSRMLVINGVIYFLCLAPFQITTLYYILDDDASKADFVWTHVCRVLVYINSAANPIVYNVTNPRYRKAFRQAFTMKCSGRGHNHLKHYLTNRASSMEMHVRGNTNNTRASCNSNAHSSTQQVKINASSFWNNQASTSVYKHWYQISIFYAWKLNEETVHWRQWSFILSHVDMLFEIIALFYNVYWFCNKTNEIFALNLKQCRTVHTDQYHETNT